jgi:hypothetical protein
MPRLRRRAVRLSLPTTSLLYVVLQWGCGDEPTAPIPSQPGYVLSVAAPGLTDTIFRGDSASWRFLTAPHPTGGPEIRQVTLELLVLDPPPPLLSPLVFEARWHEVPTSFPVAETFLLGLHPPDDVVFQASTNLGTWAATKGGVTLTAVDDGSLRGSFRATLVAVHPPGASLPDVTVTGSFWARRLPDL